MTNNHKKLARRAVIKITREVLKSIPIVGIIFKIVFIVMDITAVEDDSEPAKRYLAGISVLGFLPRTDCLHHRTSCSTSSLYA